MKIVIRHPITGLYRRENGAWVKDWKQAQHFSNTIEGIEFSTAKNLPAYQVMLKHATDDSFDIVVVEELPHLGGRSENGKASRPRRSKEAN